MQKRRGLERLLAVGRRRGDHHRGLADRERPGAVQQGEPPGGRPAAPSLVGDLREAGHDLLLIGLVFELLHGSRPSAWSRAVPENTTTAPQSGRTAQSFTTPADSTPSVSSSQVSLWLGGSSTRSC